MEKVSYVIRYESGEVRETEAVEEARYDYEYKNAEVYEVRTRNMYAGNVQIEIKITYRW